MKIFLIRHGLKETTPGDPPLSKHGIIQAKNTGIYLKQFSIDKIVASPLLRTKQTAELIGKELNLNYEVNNMLRERMNWGDKEGQTLEKFLEEWSRATIDRNFLPTSGDSSYQAGMRLEKFISDQESSNSIILVTHGGIIVDFLRNIFPEEVLVSASDKFIDSMDSIVKECSVTLIERNQKNYKLVSLATVDHLTLVNTF